MRPKTWEDHTYPLQGICAHHEEQKLGLLGDFAKGFVIMTVVFWIFLIIEFARAGGILLDLLKIANVYDVDLAEAFEKTLISNKKRFGMQ